MYNVHTYNNGTIYLHVLRQSKVQQFKTVPGTGTQMPWNGACIYPSLHSSYFNCLKIFNLTNWHTTSRALVFHKVGLNWDNSVIGNSKRHSKKPKTFGTFFLVDSPSPEVWSMLGHLPNLKYTAIQILTHVFLDLVQCQAGFSPCKHGYYLVSRNILGIVCMPVTMHFPR